MTLYNCKSEGDEYRITKFDRDMNVEASYLTTLSECDCPAGQRDTCRHRKMLRDFLKKKATKGNWFYNYDMMSWHPAQTDTEAEVEFEPDAAVEEAFNKLASIPGVTMLSLVSEDDIIHAHNIISDAVGEPEAKIEPKAKASSIPIVTRRL